MDEGWRAEYHKLIREEIERLNRNQEGLRVQVSALHADIQVLKVKSGIFGALSGLLVAIAWMLLRGKAGGG